MDGVDPFGHGQSPLAGRRSVSAELANIHLPVIDLMMVPESLLRGHAFGGHEDPADRSRPLLAVVGFCW